MSAGSLRADREVYVKPQVLATYSKEELAETVRPHGQVPSYTDQGCGTGCGCGCGCSVLR